MVTEEDSSPAEGMCVENSAAIEDSSGSRESSSCILLRVGGRVILILVEWVSLTLPDGPNTPGGGGEEGRRIGDGEEGRDEERRRGRKGRRGGGEGRRERERKEGREDRKEEGDDRKDL